MTVAVVYQAAGPDAKRSYGRAPGELIVGKVKIRLPKGDRAAQPPGAAALRRRLRDKGLRALVVEPYPRVPGRAGRPPGLAAAAASWG